MPSARLICMGLLSKYPQKSSVFKKFVNATASTRYTEYERMHITATYFTPGLPRSWIAHQFAREGLNPEVVLVRMGRIAYKPEHRRRWEPIGYRNIQFIGQPEVERYYERRPPHIRMTHPEWVTPVFNDHLKQGWSMMDISRKYGLHPQTVRVVVRRNMFIPIVRGNKHSIARKKVDGQPFE